MWCFVSTSQFSLTRRIKSQCCFWELKKLHAHEPLWISISCQLRVYRSIFCTWLWQAAGEEVVPISRVLLQLEPSDSHVTFHCCPCGLKHTNIPKITESRYKYRNVLDQPNRPVWWQWIQYWGLFPTNVAPGTVGLSQQNTTSDSLKEATSGRKVVFSYSNSWGAALEKTLRSGVVFPFIQPCKWYKMKRAIIGCEN